MKDELGKVAKKTAENTLFDHLEEENSVLLYGVDVVIAQWLHFANIQIIVDWANVG